MRWVARLLGLFVILIVGAVAAFFLVPADRIGAMVEERFEAATGRVLTLEGDVRPGLWPSIGVKTGLVSIENAPWAQGGAMVEAESLSVNVAWQGLIGGDIRVTGVELVRPVIRLSQGADGAVNWDLGGDNGDAVTGDTAAAGSTAPATGDGEGSPTEISLDQATITDGTIIFEQAGAAPISLSGIDAILTLPDFAGPASVSLTATANGAPLSAEIAINEFERFLTEGPAPIGVSLTVAGDRVAFDGRAGLSPVSAEGTISAALAGLEAFTGLAGSPTTLPAGLGRDRIALDGALTYAGDTVSLRGAQIDADGNQLSGDLDLTLSEPRPRLVANLTGGPLDFSGGSTEHPAGSGGGGGDGGATETASGWSKEPIDVSGLGALDAEIAFSAPRIKLTQSELGQTSLRVALEDRRLVTTIRELSAYDGAIAGQVVLNGRGGLSASTDLKGSAIAIARLFAELLDFDRLIALGDMELRILTSGQSMHALMNGMNGDGSFRFGAGELLGLDLVGMLRNLDPSFVGAGASTIFDEITGTFRIVDGVVINDNLSMLAPLLTAKGNGTVGLGGQTLDYRIVPTLLAGEGEGISVPVIISGSWDAPKFRLDLESLVDAKVEAEIEAAKDKLEEKAKQKVLEEVGAGAGQNAEEAVKNKVENELKKGLRSLFD